MSTKSSNRNIKQKTRTVGAALAVPLVLGGAGAGAFITNANAVDNTSATTAAANQARTEKAVTATLANFKGKAPDQTINNYVHWVFNDSDLPQYSNSSRTTYTVKVADLAGVAIKPETLLVGVGATNGDADTLDLPLLASEDNSRARQGNLTLGSGAESTTIRANADGTITIPRNDDSTQRLTFDYSVEKADGTGTVSQRITFNPTMPTLQQGAVTANTTIGQLGTTNSNPTEVNVGKSGDVTFTYTNNSQITATTAPGETSDGKIRLSMTRDGKAVELESVEIKPGETKTISVQNVKASDVAGEVTGSDFRVIEKVPGCDEPLRVSASDHLAASPIHFNDVAGDAETAFAKLFFDKDVKRAAPVLPVGANVETYPAKTSASDYFSKGGNGGLAAVTNGNWRADSETAQCHWGSEKPYNYDYSVYVKPVAVAEPTPEPTPSDTPEPTPTVEPTPEPTPTTPEVTPEPSVPVTPAPVPSETTPPVPSEKPTPAPSTPPAPKPSEPVVTPSPEPSAPVTPAPVPSKPAVTPSTEPTPSETPAPVPSESTPPAPTQEVTTPAPSVTPSEPAVEKPSEPAVVKPSEPGKKVEAKTGHEQEAAKDPTGLIAGISAIVVAALVFFFGRKHFAKWSADAKAKKAAKEAAKGDTKTTAAESSESAESEPTAEGEK
jgi:hypothetical protein